MEASTSTGAVFSATTQATPPMVTRMLKISGNRSVSPSHTQASKVLKTGTSSASSMASRGPISRKDSNSMPSPTTKPMTPEIPR